ncbi:hypothetical protein PRIPAC_75916 [Pristionchus pacificus]|uniref:Uncharacterized protein n=1 Tax=Pristionchus pacificus TaxID=54126 RepID=A0A2A6C143_PRIPA|nr:hypothetical protein PRIPAC_75916 [Pristionchus pacificus]|eukprot:PDM71828.1 hypothetical protein PRIPAC_38235 [Pristionchus pacificus]
MMTLQQQQQQPPTGTYLLPSSPSSQLDDAVLLAEQSARLHNGLCSSGGCEWCVRRARVATRLRDLCDDFDRAYFGGGRGDEQKEEEQEQEREEPSLVASAFTKLYTAIFTRFFS